jgi:hypothetical protein
VSPREVWLFIKKSLHKIKDPGYTPDYYYYIGKEDFDRFDRLFGKK